MPESVAAAPEAVKVPATIAASVSRDFGKFREASQAKSAGKPLPDVDLPAETVSGDSTEAGRAINAKQRRRDREQARINEQIRSGVEAATKAKDAEIAALKAKPAEVAPAAAIVEAKPVAATEEKPVTVPDYKRYAAMPDAPKINAVDAEGNAIFNTLDEHSAAMALFIADKRYEERSAADKDRASQEDRVKTLVARDDAYRERIAPKGDLTFLQSLQPHVLDKSFRPIESLQASEPVTPINLLASKVVESEQAKELLQYLSDHPEQFKKFSTLRTPDAVFVEFGKLVGSLDPPKEAAPRPKLVSEASKPVTQFAARNAAPSDPVLKASKDRNFRAFRAGMRAREAAKRAS